jgi:hypothetical protein
MERKNGAIGANAASFEPPPTVVLMCGAGCSSVVLGVMKTAHCKRPSVNAEERLADGERDGSPLVL